MTAPAEHELRAFEHLVLQVRTLLEEMNGGLAIAAKRARATGEDWTAAPHLSWMLSVALRCYSRGRLERAQRYLGHVQGVMAVKYGLNRAELARLGLWRGMDPAEGDDPEECE